MKGHAVFILCFCVALTFGQESDYGIWGDWGEPSECSRTCGGGVSHQTRKCHHGIPGVSRGCQGKDIRHESCNTQPCPEGLESFRSVQCRRFNSQQYTWMPHQDDRQQCALVCRDAGTDRVQMLRDRVVDGTECDSPDSLGICLDGVCKEVGCDRRLDSPLREDPCLVCGGRGDTCQTITGTVTQDKLHSGENHIITIPQGSTSITVREVAAESSAIVLRGRDGTVYLDSRDSPADSSEMVVTGAMFRYRRAALADDSVSVVLRARGPTNETLQVKLDYGGEQTGLEYEYSVPKAHVLEANPNQPYTWIHGEWTSCSKECGDGYQRRAVSCIDRSSGGSTPDRNCPQSEKPDTSQACNIKPCGTADNWYRWVPGHWGRCSVQCGVGEQTQEMSCVETGASGDTVYVSNELCERYSDKPPVYKRACEGDGDECPYWATTAWGECSVTCGHGVKTRRVLCQRDPADPTGIPIRVDEAQCTLEQPDTRAACRLDACPDGSNAHGMVTVEDDEDCEDSAFGCCQDGVTAASGQNGYGCPSTSSATNMCLLEPERGPCSDYSIKWHFVPQEQHCRRFWYGGCRGNDNRFDTEEACETKCLQKDSAAENLVTGDCTSRVFGCCPDGATPARGPNKEGCPDVDVSSVSLCRRSRFGCCDDGVTAASGPNKQGCDNGDDDIRLTVDTGDRTEDGGRGEADCRRSRYGCCPDGATAARGENQEGCRTEVELQRKCEQSYYGCCPDSDVAASGPNKEGCESSDSGSHFDTALCSGPQDRGTCSDYTVKWYYDTAEARCKRFWYGGCGGNGNKFDTEELCQQGCIDVTGEDACLLPAVKGPCRSRHFRYFYNPKTAKCEVFTYGGCKGNDNRFRTQEECQTRCSGTGTQSSQHGGDDNDHDHDKDEKEAIWPLRVEGPQNMTVAEGQTVRFRCRILNDPDATIRWLKSSTVTGEPENLDNMVDNTEVLDLVAVRVDDAGEYRCRAGNKWGYMDTSAFLTVTHTDHGTDHRLRPSGQVERCSQTRYGCCRDGVSPAGGPNYRGCRERCENSRYGCCDDDVTPAEGPFGEGCFETGSGFDGDCEDTRYGCCPDGVTTAAGPNQRGCYSAITTTTTTPRTTTTTTRTTTTVKDWGTDRCSKPSVRGQCTDYVVRWFYDTSRQECAQFWYGGCQGNDNRFDTRDDCEAECMASDGSPDDPDFVSICDMPREEGSCRGRLPRWFYDPLNRQCRTFLYTGCDGNENNFVSLQLCQQTCMGVVPTAAPTTTTTTTTPAPYTFNPPPSTSSLVMTGSDKVLEGSELRLTCRADGPSTPMEIQWFINGRSIGREHDHLSIRSYVEASERSMTSELIISRSRKENTATYYCRSIPYSDVERKTVVVSKVPSVRTTTTTPFPTTTTLQPRRRPDPANRESTDPAVVCRMPQRRGRCRAYFRRWSFDPRSGACAEFVYGGCDGNSNNFQTQQACQTFCRDYAGRQPGGNTGGTYPDRSNQGGTSTGGTYPGGNTESNDPNVVCSMPAVTGRCRANMQRFYYDPNYRQCRQFVYGGCNGNSNNFRTKQECDNYCGRQESRPGTGSRPTTSDTTNSNDPSVVCKLPASVGNCRAQLPRYYYNHETGRCTLFYYGGCNGNSNNFDNEEKCNQFCRPEESRPGTGSRPTSSDTTISNDPSVVCMLPASVGNCRAQLPRYHYNHEKGRCTLFYYGGCNGNSNNFDTEDKCNQYCRAEDICRLPKLVGPCRSGLTRYYYDTSLPGCQQFIYGGCQGNLNNFGTMQACQSKCRNMTVTTGTLPTVNKNKQICKLNPDAGTCREYNISWYYDSVLERCQRFVYTGCDGNENRFTTEEACVDFCRDVDSVTEESAGDVCSMAHERGRCTDYEILWYYDKDKGYCTRFYYGGCGGNGNRFSSEEECQQRCDQRAREVTTTPVSPRRRACSYSRYGCCPDGITPAVDAFRTNCKDDSVVVRPSGDGNVVLANRGSMAILDCYSPGSAVSWYRDGYYLTSDSRFTIHNNGTLVINNINDDISGNYACRIVDGNNIPQIRRYELKVKNPNNTDGTPVPLSILPTPPNVKTPPGENAYLHCQAFGTPKPVVSWTKNGAPVRSGGRYVVFNNGTLLISAVTAQDASKYQCSAQNGVDPPVTKDMKLLVSQDLTAEIQSHSGSIMEGDTATLSCTAKGYPPPTVTWQKDGVPVTPSTKKIYVRGSSLTIPRAAIDDAGLYTCLATNRMGKAKDVTYIQVKPNDHKQQCTDKMRRLKCRLIVSANLCGHRMFSGKCCKSCRDAGFLRK